MQPAHVLLVKDGAGNAFLTQQVLETCPLSLTLHIARDGEHAFAILADGQFKPDLIILDLSIPRISGLALLRRYPSRDVPVVVFSVSSRETDKQLALALGASEYLQKPVDVRGFTDVVCGIIERWAMQNESSAHS